MGTEECGDGGGYSDNGDFDPTIGLGDLELASVTLNDEAEELYQLFLLFQATQHQWWSNLPFDSLTIFLAIILSRESFNAWGVDNWFTKKLGDPASMFMEASARWFSTWIQDPQIVAKYGEVVNSADKNAMLFNWLAEAMQSADNITLNALIGYGNNWHTGFISVASETRNPTNQNWASGDGMWSWANAYIYDSEGQALLAQNNLYSYGFGAETWYILNADQVRLVESHNCFLSSNDC